jgi:D-alanyl-D-alanine carboxypeptidase
MGTLRTNVGRFFCFLVVVYYTISSSSLWAVQKASIVICAETGKVLHEQNADAVTPPASLTKMMTLYLTFKALREGRLTFDQKLSVSKRASLAAPCKLWLKSGSTITVRDAILGMVTKSANDASIAIAEELGKGSEDHFAALMTQQARKLGMSQTVFKNSHGLPEKQQSRTSARDMAIMSLYLYKHFPEYFKFFKEPKFAYKGQVHTNHNRLLGKIPGLDGIKTGFINASGFNLAASVVRNNRRIIAVVMGGESAQARNNKMVKLLEATYSNLGMKNAGPQKKNDCSIGDLICALSSSDARETPTKAKIHRAVDRGQWKPKVTYTSMNDILDEDLKKDRVRKVSPKKKVQKSLTRKEKKVTKKNRNHKSNNKIKK